MTKRLCKFSLTGFQCLVFYKLIQQGKRIILVGDNKFKVVDDNECVYFDSVLGVCDIDGSVNCPCENYERMVRWEE